MRDRDSTDIVNILSAEGEKVKLVSPVKTSGLSVELWMRNLETSTNQSVAKFIQVAQQEAEKDEDNKGRSEWIKNTFSQAVCVVSSIMWC
jgi:hypothetical protein